MNKQLLLSELSLVGNTTWFDSADMSQMRKPRGRRPIFSEAEKAFQICLPFFSEASKMRWNSSGGVGVDVENIAYDDTTYDMFVKQ